MSLRSDFGYVSDKKVHTAAKYHGVQSRLDTGASASKRPPAMPSSEKARHVDEIFKRIRPSTLSRLIGEQQEEGMESVFNLAPDNDDGASQSSVKGSVAPPAKSRVAASVAGTRVSVAGSVLSVIDSDTCVAESRNLVVIDVRESEEYDRCRLPFAISYPAVKLNRDQFIPELLKCKRDPSKLLVVYHASDAATAAFATLLVRKGWESVYALSGGFDEMVSSYPELLDGEVPERKMSSRPNTGSTVATGSGYGRQPAPRVPGEIRRGNSIPRHSSSCGRSASASSRAGSSRSASIRSSSVR